LRTSLSVKVLGSVLLISLIFFLAFAYFNIKNTWLLLEASYVEKARTIVRLLDASIKTKKELKDKSRLYANIQKNIWLDPDISSIDINLPYQEIMTGLPIHHYKLVTYVSNMDDRVGSFADGESFKSFKNDKLITKVVEKGNQRHLKVITPIHIEKEQVGTYQIELTLEHVDAEISRTIKVSIYSYLTMISLYLLLHFLMLRFIIIKPLFKLKRGVKAIAKSDLHYRVDIESNDEIGDLASSFNQMAKDHEKTTVSKDKLKEQKEKLASTNENLIMEVKQRKQTQEKLLQARKLAEVASRTKSEFLANMSHELRTPLNHIIGFTELVLDKKLGELNDHQEEYLCDVHQSSQHLLSLINDILDLSKVEAGKLELQPSNINLRELLENSFVMVKEKAMKNGIQLLHNINGIPETIIADERKLKQILYNLLSNAVKFTLNGGKITLTTRICDINNAQFTSPDNNRNCGIIVSIYDTGIGIISNDIDRIFKPFEQLKNTTNREIQGTGLGLSLTKSLVELHGGKIWAESEGEGKGATFSFSLPV